MNLVGYLTPPRISYSFLALSCLKAQLFKFTDEPIRESPEPFSIYGSMVHSLAETGVSMGMFYEEHFDKYKDYPSFRELKLEAKDTYDDVSWIAVGVIDYAVIHPEDGLLLFDWKTGKNFHDIQAQFYAYLIGLVFPNTYDKVKFCFVSPTKTKCYYISTKGTALILRPKISRIIRSLRRYFWEQGMIPPNVMYQPSECYFCSYRQSCPVFKNSELIEYRAKAYESMAALARASASRLKKIDDLQRRVLWNCITTQNGYGSLSQMTSKMFEMW